MQLPLFGPCRPHGVGVTQPRGLTPGRALRMASRFTGMPPHDAGLNSLLSEGFLEPWLIAN